MIIDPDDKIADIRASRLVGRVSLDEVYPSRAPYVRKVRRIPSYASRREGRLCGLFRW